MIAVGKPAPDFEGESLEPSGQLGSQSLSNYKDRYLVLFFYPLDWTFVCPSEIISFSDRIGEFTDIDTAVVGVSVDSKFSHLAWTKTPRTEGGLGDVKFPLIGDITKKISRDYGVLIEDAGIALRGLFIIDGKGVLRSMIVNDLPVGRSVDETLRLVKAFKFVDQHGEVCPANWKPGDRTIKATPHESKAFFQAAYGTETKAEPTKAEHTKVEHTKVEHTKEAGATGKRSRVADDKGAKRNKS